MGSSTQFSLPPINAQAIAPATEVKVTVLSTPVIGNEYTHILQSGVKQIEIQPRGICELNFRFQNSGDYKTLFKCNSFHITDINFTGKTLYIKNSATIDIEITEYY